MFIARLFLLAVILSLRRISHRIRLSFFVFRFSLFVSRCSFFVSGSLQYTVILSLRRIPHRIHRSLFVCRYSLFVVLKRLAVVSCQPKAQCEILRCTQDDKLVGCWECCRVVVNRLSSFQFKRQSSYTKQTIPERTNNEQRIKQRATKNQRATIDALLVAQV